MGPVGFQCGDRRKNPLTAMEETVLVMRRLLNMERVTFDGEFVHVKGIELDVVHGRREPRNVPIYVGATGPKMLEWRKNADGALLNYCVPPKYNERALDSLKVGRRNRDEHWMTSTGRNWSFVRWTRTATKHGIPPVNC